MKRGWDLALGAAILAGALALRWADPLPLQQLRNLTFDTYQRLQPRSYEPALPVVIGAIDEKALDAYGQWPWSRGILARLAERLTEMGAAAVAFDAIFAEPDRTSPVALARNLPDTPDFEATRRQLAQLPDPDADFAAALAQAPSVLAFTYSDDPALAGASMPEKFGITTISDPELTVADFIRGGKFAIMPLPQLVEAARGLGDVQVGFPDADGITRRVPLVSRVGDVLFPSLGAEALRVALGGQTAQIRASKQRAVRLLGIGFDIWLQGIDKMRIGEAILPVNANGELWLRDSGPRPERFVSLADVLAPDADATRFEGKIVLIGATVEGLKDLHATPLSPFVPGVEIHAQILEQILSGTYLDRPYFADFAEMVILGVLGLALLACLHRRSALGGTAVLVVALTAVFAASWWQFSAKGFLFDPVYPALAAILMFGGGTLVNFLRTEGEKRFVRNAMARYLSPILADQVSRHPERLKLGGELRELTLMFCDIRGFTKLSESLDPQALTGLINSFLTPMTQVIQDREGFIDKYIGDCIMAFWNAPVDVPSHAAKAILAAYDMRAALIRINAELKAEAEKAGRPPVEIRMGMGLNTGICCVGNMGSEQRLEYSVLGDTVNIASRLEGLSQAYGVDLVIGEETATGAPDFALLELDRVRVKGKAVPIRIYTGLGASAEAQNPPFLALREAQGRLLAAYRAQEWDAADAALARCRMLAGPVAGNRLDGFYDLYAARIAAYRNDPPPPDWDGVYEAKSKAG